ncbi:hypothetical protein [Natronolimnohabitans innermongolicus]|nr:hypothetical protein [Natronolimnohabitans innermongolicus]
MRPSGLYGMSGLSGLESVTPVLVSDLGFEAYTALSALERSGFQLVATLAVAVVVLGLLQGYGPTTVSTARRSPVISVCVGLPSVLVVVGLTSVGYLLVGTSLGTFFGIPMAVFGAAVLVVLTVLGFVTIGRAIAARLGRDRLWVGVVVGSAVAGLAGLSIPLTVAVAGMAGMLGLGAGARVLVSTGGVSRPDERTVPPANKI